MWGVAKIFTSGHSKVGFDQTPRTPPGYGYERSSSVFLTLFSKLMLMNYIINYNKRRNEQIIMWKNVVKVPLCKISLLQLKTQLLIIIP